MISFKIAQYLAKNSLNPLLKRSIGRYALYTLLALLAFILVLPPLFIRKNTSTYPPWVTSLGLSRSLLKDSTSATLTLAFLLTLIRGRREVAASEEAEHELILALPLTMSEYLVGKTLYFAIQTLLYMVPLVFVSVPLIYTAVDPNPLRPLLLVASIPLIAIYSESLVMLATLLRIASGDRRLPEIAGYLYLGFSAIHSLLVRQISPLLSWPSLPATSPMIDVFSRRVDLPQLSLETLALLLSTLALLALVAIISRFMHPENVRPLHEILRDLGLKRRGATTIKNLGPVAAVRKVVVELSLLNSSHILLLLIGLLLTPAIAVLLRRANLVLDPLTISSFGMIFLASEATITTAFTVQRDLSNLWLYRTCPASLKPLTGALMAKTLVYYSEGFILVALFRAAYDSRLVWLFLPFFSLPLALLSATVVISLLVKIAASRRLVRYSSRGFYMVEDVVATTLMGATAVMAVVSLTLYELMVEYSTSLLEPVILTVSSLAISTIIWRVSEDLLYRQLWFTEVR